MKLLIASDIHGSAYYCEKLLSAFKKEGAGRILLLGDILYHGPRNDLPLEYAPKRVAAMLNEYKNKILCVRGNCEAEVDQMMLDFPVLADYAVVLWENRLIYATHGHVFNEEKLPPISKGDILLCGHTHVPALNIHEDFIYMNPGSVSIPKENSRNGYMTAEGGCFLWKDFSGEILKRYEL